MVYMSLTPVIGKNQAATKRKRDHHHFNQLRKFALAMTHIHTPTHISIEHQRRFDNWQYINNYKEH